MGRWDCGDDPRDGQSSDGRSGHGRGTADHRSVHIERLPDGLSARSVEVDGRREHGLVLPSGLDREAIHLDGRILHLRGSEVDLLERTGRFRVTLTADLKADAGGTSRVDEDLRSLVRHGLLAERSVTRLKDGAQESVVSATPRGQRLLDTHRDPQHDRGQTYYSGWVKPREVWHDAQLFRMVRTLERELDREGATIRRVVLDDELKARTSRALAEARETCSERSARYLVAHHERLHVQNERFVFPDVRVEVEQRDGSVRTIDLELVTRHYHRGQVSGKANAGFRMFGGRDSTTGGGGSRGPDVVGRLLR
jgi:hypothetical protein